MNHERDDKEMDELVSATYHGLASEKAPAPLDKLILRMAAHEHGNAGGQDPTFAPWKKPLAWAASIGLSLVVVLELGQDPENTVARDAVPAAVTAAPAAERMRVGKPTALEEKIRPMKTRAQAQLLVPNACAATVRDTREEWLDCINELRDLGSVEEANLETAALLLEYPAD